MRRGKKWTEKCETRRNSRQEMGNETDFETRNGRKWETRRETSFFIKKQEKQGKTGTTGEETPKNRKEQKITRNTETRF